MPLKKILFAQGNVTSLTLNSIETFLSSYYGWGIQKKHPLRESINRGYVTFFACFFILSVSLYFFFYNFKRILRTLESGLVETWTKRNLPILDKRCNSFRDQKTIPNENNNQPPRLNFKNLMGPFIILLFGYIAALFAIVSEQMIYCIWNRR